MAVATRRPRRLLSAQSIRSTRNVLTFAERSEAAKRGALSMTPAERSERTRKGWLKRKRAMPVPGWPGWPTGTAPSWTPWSAPGAPGTPPQGILGTLPYTHTYLYAGGSMGAGALSAGNVSQRDEVVAELKAAIEADPNGDLIVDTAALLTGQPGDAFFAAIAAGLHGSSMGDDADVIQTDMALAADNFIDAQNSNALQDLAMGGPYQGGSTAADQRLAALLVSLPHGNLLLNHLVANTRPMDRRLTPQELGARLKTTGEFLHEKMGALTTTQRQLLDADVDTWLASAPPSPIGQPFTPPPPLAEQVPGRDVGVGGLPNGIAPLAGQNALGPGTAPGPVVLTPNEIKAREHYIQALRHDATWKTGGPNDTLTVYANASSTDRDKRNAQREALVDMIFAEAANRGVQRRPKGQRHSLVTGGPVGSGKSTALARNEAALGGPFLVVNIDDITDRLVSLGMVPTMPGLSPSESVHLVRNEANNLRDEVFARAMSEGWDIAYDTTMMHGPFITNSVLAPMHNAGYEDPVALFVSVPNAQSVQSAETRWIRAVQDWMEKGDLSPGDGGRFISPNVPARNTAKVDTTLPSGSAETFLGLARAGTFKQVMAFDNAGNFPLAKMVDLNDVLQTSTQLRNAIAVSQGIPSFYDKTRVAVAEGELARRKAGRSNLGQGVATPGPVSNPPPPVPAPNPNPVVTATVVPPGASPLTMSNYQADPRYAQFSSATGYAGVLGSLGTVVATRRGNAIQRRIATQLKKLRIGGQPPTSQQIDAVLTIWAQANLAKPVGGNAALNIPPLTDNQFNHFLANNAKASYQAGLAASSVPQPTTATTPTPPTPQPTGARKTLARTLGTGHILTGTISATLLGGNSDYVGMTGSEQSQALAGITAAIRATGYRPTADEVDNYLASAVSNWANAYSVLIGAISARNPAPQPTPTVTGTTWALAQGGLSARVSLVTASALAGHPIFAALSAADQVSAYSKNLVYAEKNDGGGYLTANEINTFLTTLTTTPNATPSSTWGAAYAAMKAEIALRPPSAPTPAPGVTSTLLNPTAPNYLANVNGPGAIIIGTSGLAVGSTLVSQDPRIVAMGPAPLGPSAGLATRMTNVLSAEASNQPAGLRAMDVDAYIDGFIATPPHQGRLVNALNALKASVATPTPGSAPATPIVPTPAPPPPTANVGFVTSYGAPSIYVPLSAVQGDSRYTAMGPSIRSAIDQDYNVAGNPWAGPWTAEEADAYLDTVQNNPVSAAEQALAAVRALNAPPSVPASGAHVNRLTGLMGVGTLVSLQAVQGDPRYKSLRTYLQGRIDTLHASTNNPTVQGPWTAGEADALLDALVANPATGMTPGIAALHAVRNPGTPAPPPLGAPPTSTLGPLATKLGATGSIHSGDILNDPRWATLTNLLINRDVQDDLTRGSWMTYPNAEEADAYIDAAIDHAQNNPTGYTSASAKNAGQTAVMAHRGLRNQGGNRPPPPTPTGRLTAAYGPKGTITLNALQGDPRYTGMGPGAQSTTDNDFLHGAAPYFLAGNWTAEEADAYLDLLTTSLSSTGGKSPRELAREAIETLRKGTAAAPPVYTPVPGFPDAQRFSISGGDLARFYIGNLYSDPRYSKMASGDARMVDRDMEKAQQQSGITITNAMADLYLDTWDQSTHPNSLARREAALEAMGKAIEAAGGTAPVRPRHFERMLGSANIDIPLIDITSALNSHGYFKSTSQRWQWTVQAALQKASRNLARPLTSGEIDAYLDNLDTAYGRPQFSTAWTALRQSLTPQEQIDIDSYFPEESTVAALGADTIPTWQQIEKPGGYRDKRTRKWPVGLMQLVNADLTNTQWVFPPSATEVDTYLDSIAEDIKNAAPGTRLTAPYQRQLTMRAMDEIAMQRGDFSHMPPFGLPRPAVRTYGTPPAGPLVTPNTNTGRLTAQAAGKADAAMRWFDITTDPRFQALDAASAAAVHLDFQNGWSRPGQVVGGMGWNAGEADAYLDAWDPTDVEVARRAWEAQRAANPPPAPPPPKPAPGYSLALYGPGHTLLLADIQNDPRYMHLDPTVQTSVTADFSALGGNPWSGPWTSEEADAYLDQTIARYPADGKLSPHSSPNSYVTPGRRALISIRAAQALPAGVPYSTGTPRPPVSVPAAFYAGRFEKVNFGPNVQVSLADIQIDPRYKALGSIAQTDVDAAYTVGSPIGKAISGPWTSAEADAYLDYRAAHPNDHKGAGAALQAVRAPAAPAPTPAPTPTPAPAAPTPVAPAALPSSVQGLHNTWASDPRAAFLFQGTQPSTPGQTAPAPTPSANNSHKRVINAIDRSGSTLGLTQTADLDEANDIALSRYVKEWNDQVALGNDPALMTTSKLGKWLYVARTMALSDIHEQMGLNNRTDVVVPPALDAQMKKPGDYYVTAAKKVKQQNLISPLLRIGVPTGTPLGGVAPTSAIGPAPTPAAPGAPSVPGAPVIAVKPKAGQWPQPTNPVDFGNVEGQLANMPTIYVHGNSGQVDWTAQRKRRDKWINSITGTTRNQRKELADAADRMMNHANHSIVPSSPSGGFEGIRDAAHQLANVKYIPLQSQTYKGGPSQQDYDDAQILMRAASQADFVPDRDGSGEHKMYRGMVMPAKDLAQLQPGMFMTEALGSYTTKEDYAHAYMTLRGRGGAMHVSGRDENVLLEVVDAHGVPITPLAYTDRSGTHGTSDEILSSGQFEIEAITTSQDPVVSFSGSGTSRSSQTRTVTHIRLRHISPGWDFTNQGVVLVGSVQQAAAGPVTGTAVAPGGSLTTPGTGPVINLPPLHRSRRTITPPGQGTTKKTNALVSQTDATQRGIVLATMPWSGKPGRVSPAPTAPGPALTAMGTSKVPVRGTTPVPSTYPNVDLYWTYAGRVAPGKPGATEVFGELLNMAGSTPYLAAMKTLATDFGFDLDDPTLSAHKVTDKEIAFLATMLKSYEAGDTWDTARDKAIAAAYTVANHLNGEVITPARNKPSPITDTTAHGWVDNLMTKDALVGSIFADAYLANGGNVGAGATSAYERAADTVDGLELSGTITPQAAKDLRKYLGAGLPKPPKTAGTNLSPSAQHLRYTYKTASTFNPLPTVPLPPRLHVANPNIAATSARGAGTPAARPWDPDLLGPAAEAAGIPQDTVTYQALWAALGHHEQASIRRTDWGPGVNYTWDWNMKSVSDPQKIAEQIAIMRAYLAARQKYGYEEMSGAQAVTGRNAAKKARQAEHLYITQAIAAIKAQAAAANPAAAAAAAVAAGRPARARFDAMDDVMVPRPDADPNVMRGSRYEFGDFLGFVRDPVVQEQIEIGAWGDGSQVVDAFGMENYMRSGNYNGTGQAHGDKVMMLLGAVQGYLDQPDLVTEDEMNEYIRNGEWAIYRGVSGGSGVFNSARSGTFSYSSGVVGGQIAKGRGTYWMSGEQGNASAQTNRDNAYTNATSFGTVMRATFRPDAHVAREQDFVNMVNIVRADTNLTPEEKQFLIGDYAKGTGKVSSVNLNNLTGLTPSRMGNPSVDPALLSLAFGFDAYYKDEPSTANNFLTVLNRTALRIQVTPAKGG